MIAYRNIVKTICVTCAVWSGVIAAAPVSSPGPAGAERRALGPPTSGPGSVPSEPRLAGPPPCRNKRKLYTVAPVAPSDLSHILPLGNMAPPGHVFPTRHLYLHIRRQVAGDHLTPSVEVPVAAPGRIWVTRIGSSENITQGVTDYRINFSACAEQSAYFLHLTTLAPNLLKKLGKPRFCDEYTAGGDRYRLCQASVNVQLEAGDPVGTAGGGQDRNALDLGASDARVPELLYANPDRWPDDGEQLHVVCALDYFVPVVRRRLRKLLGDPTTRRRRKPRCGQVAHDVRGTLQGIWFVPRSDEFASEDRQLSMAHDNVVPTKGVFSVGTSMARSGLGSRLYHFEPVRDGAINRDFDQASEIGKVYCYEVQERFARESDPVIVILAQLTAAATVRLERSERSSCGSGPWRLGLDFTEFER